MSSSRPFANSQGQTSRLPIATGAHAGADRGEDPILANAAGQAGAVQHLANRDADADQPELGACVVQLLVHFRQRVGGLQIQVRVGF
jgi:hypothetical protein